MRVEGARRPSGWERKRLRPKRPRRGREGGQETAHSNRQANRVPSPRVNNFKNEPKKLFIINKSAQKTNPERTQTNPNFGEDELNK